MSFFKQILAMLVAAALMAGVRGAVATPLNASAAKPVANRGVEIENLGPGNFSFPLLGALIVDDTIYVGSRNLSPTRVAGFHFPAGRVTSTFQLGNGAYVQSLATDGRGVIYAGVTHAQPDVNLYRWEVATGEVTGVAAVPGQSVAALAVASDGTVYMSGRPEGRSRGPALFSYDPKTGKLTNLGVPDPDAGQTLGLAVTDTTVYFGCGASSAGGGPAGLFAIDRKSGAVTDILPPEMRRDHQINKVMVLGDILVIGGAQVGVMDLATGEWQVTRVGTRQHQFTRAGDSVFAASSGGLHRIDLKTWTVSRLGDPGGGLGDYQGLGVMGDLIVGAMSGGHVWTFDRGNGERQIVDLVEAGAPGDGEAGQSIGVLGDKIYVGGNNSVAVHDLNGGAMKKLPIHGEVKDMVAVDGTMYMATYAPAAIWAHCPAKSDSPRRVLALPPSANRPRDVRWDDVNKLVVIGVRSDSGGGSLCLFDPATETLTNHRDPLGSSQWVWNVAPANGLLYIAGANRGGHSGNIAAWDPKTGREVWRMDNPLGEGGGVSGLVVIRDRLFGVAIGGVRFFVIDISSAKEPELIYEGDLSAFAPAPTPLVRLLVDRGLIYALSNQTVFRIDPVTFETEALVSGLDADWFSGPRMAFDGNHDLYTFAGRTLIRIRDESPR